MVLTGLTRSRRRSSLSSTNVDSLLADNARGNTFDAVIGFSLERECQSAQRDARRCSSAISMHYLEHFAEHMRAVPTPGEVTDITYLHRASPARSAPASRGRRTPLREASAAPIFHCFAGRGIYL